MVTGAAGLLGTTLVKQLLSDGHRVRAMINQTALPLPSHDNLEIVSCDLLDVIALESCMHDVQFLYHCAGKVSFTSKDKKALYDINVRATANVVNAALEAGVHKMVHVSSVAALGRLRENQSIDETANWTKETSNSVYGQSKYLGELEVWRGIAEGLNAVIVNPTIILGPGNWNEGSTAIFKNVYEEFSWYSDGTTGFVDVRDVCKAMTILMESDIVAERFIVSAENATYQHVFNLMADAFGKKRPSKKVTPLLAALVWRLEACKSVITGKAPLITKETAATALAHVYFENQKLKNFLPDFHYTSLQETIQYSCRQLLA